MSAELPKSRQAAIALEIIHAHAMARVFPRIAGEMHLRDMSFSQLTALMQVFMNGAQTISEIARGADISHNATSRMVDRLVMAGLLSRTEDPEDRRQKRVELTDKGAAFPPELRKTTIGAYADLLAPIPSDVLEQLDRALSELITYLPPVPEPHSR